MEQIQLSKDIIDQIKQAQTGEVLYNRFYVNDENISGRNEFLMFIKPELTMPNPDIKLDQVIDQILQSIKYYNLDVASANLLSAEYLRNYDIIAQHYGVINRLSNDIRKNISESAKKTFNHLFDVDFDDAEVYGSFEFLEEFPDFTPLTLDYFWQNVPFEKLAGGTYVMKLDFNGRNVFLINGFHPRQLAHFTEDGRSIVALTLIGDLDWEKARNELIGATSPEKAQDGSLRRLFLDQQKELGLPAISSSWNGVHLSAGPVEGLVELMRYNSNFHIGDTKKPEDFQFGEQLLSTFNEGQVYDILKNENIQYQGETTNIFDLTEEMNSDDALEILKKVYH